MSLQLDIGQNLEQHHSAIYNQAKIGKLDLIKTKTKNPNTNKIHTSMSTSERVKIVCTVRKCFRRLGFRVYTIL